MSAKTLSQRGEAFADWFATEAFMETKYAEFVKNSDHDGARLFRWIAGTQADFCLIYLSHGQLVKDHAQEFADARARSVSPEEREFVKLLAEHPEIAEQLKDPHAEEEKRIENSFAVHPGIWNEVLGCPSSPEGTKPRRIYCKFE
jgi:hypothetical protein